MRILFATGLACVACALVQCTPRLFNSGSDVKDVKDIASMQNDGTGKFTVKCRNGRVETSVTDEMIVQRKVCLPIIRQVNPKAFTAFGLWRDGLGTEILDYPQGYEDTKGTSTPDGVFYVEPAGYWEDIYFTATPTEGAKVVNDVLEYPVNNGMQLKLKFTALNPNRMNHAEAVQHCKKQGLRLPTVRELFDFCASGVSEPNYGPNYRGAQYPTNARCGGGYSWSASVTKNRLYAWQFSGNISSEDRRSANGVRCVGPAS